MTAVMQEALRLLREELLAEMKKIEDSSRQLTLKVEAQESFSRDAEIQRVKVAMQQLTLKVEAQESFCKGAEIQKVEDAMQQLTLRVEAQESICKGVECLSKEVKQHGAALKSQQSSVVLQHLQAIKAQQKGLLGTFEQELEKIRSDCVTHKDLARIEEQMNTLDSSKNGISKKPLANDTESAQSTYTINDVQDAQATPETIEHVDKRISELHANLSQIKFQMQAMTTDWEATRGATLSELRKQGAAMKEGVDNRIAEVLSELQQHRAATREHVDVRLSELYFVLSQIEGRLEAKNLSKINDECMTDQLSAMRADLEEVQRQLTERSVQLSHEEGLTAMMESTNKQVSQMKNEIQEMQTQLSESNVNLNSATSSNLEALRESTQKYANEKISELNLHLSHVQAKQEAMHLTGPILEMRADVEGVQRRLSDCINEKVLQMKSDIREMQTQSPESNVSSNSITCSDPEAVREATKECVDEKSSEVHSHLSQVQAKQEPMNSSKINYESTTDQLSETRADVEEMQEQLSEHSMPPSREELLKATMQHTNKPAFQSDMQDMRTHLSENDLNPEVVDCRNLGGFREATKEYVIEKNSEVQQAISQIQDRQEIPLLQFQGCKATTNHVVDKQMFTLQSRSSEIMDEHVNDEVFVEENALTPEQSIRGYQVVEEETTVSSENLMNGSFCILRAIYPSAEKIVHPQN